MADLITLSELRAALGVDPTYTYDDAKYSALIPYASAVIRNITERDFGAPLVTETRTFEYNGSGYVDIDDCVAITAVALTFPYSPGTADITLAATDWQARPTARDDSPVYTFLSMPGFQGNPYGSPEMGFARNLDVYAREHSFPTSCMVKVTATYGWPTVPGDVKMAAVWTISEWISRPSGDALTSESIEGWARAWGRGAGAAAMAVPGRARDILVAYAKVNV